MSNELANITEKGLAETKAMIDKNITDFVLEKVQKFESNGQIFFPENYSPENALKSAWLKLQEIKDKNSRLALQVCTKPSIANALFNMVIQGLNPAKNQCYFIPYGDQLTLMRSYFGTIAVAKQFGEIKELGKSVIITKKDVKINRDVESYLVIVKDVTLIQEEGAHLSRKIKEQGYVAKYSFKDIVAGHEKMIACIELSKKVAKIDATVLMTGESGTGKEVFAQSIHNESKRKDRPFIGINCAALPQSLLESELFGYEAGAFTDAKKDGKKGLFEMANRGTIFLDEIGDVPLSVQAKLLRVLQEREVMRIGGHSITPIDVRVIAATNKDIKKLVESKDFREDLYYRLNVVPIHLPPLRERRSDIPLLISYLIKEMGYKNIVIDDELMDKLVSHDWRGNVRELANCIQYMAFMSEGALKIDNAPSYILDQSTEKNDWNQGTEIDGIDSIANQSTANAILRCLRNKCMGRREICSQLNKDGYSISEYEVRKVMQLLKEEGYIDYNKGRGGAYLVK